MMYQLTCYGFLCWLIFLKKWPLVHQSSCFLFKFCVQSGGTFSTCDCCKTRAILLFYISAHHMNKQTPTIKPAYTKANSMYFCVNGLNLVFVYSSGHLYIKKETKKCFSMVGIFNRYYKNHSSNAHMDSLKWEHVNWSCVTCSPSCAYIYQHSFEIYNCT